MLSDEEKYAIDYLKIYIERDVMYENRHYKQIEIVLNLIEKQSKEIEELKEENKPQPDCAEPIEKTEEMVNMNWVNHNYIGKDKIKEILGIEENIDNEKLLSLLQTIVDENARLEDIEDRKVQIEYNNVFNKGVKSVEDKIKAKIEVLEKLQKEFPNNDEIRIKIIVYKEFLKDLEVEDD